MDTLSLDTLAARVVAWHNHHPLARRITAAEVLAAGYVALPYTAPDDGSAASGVDLVADDEADDADEAAAEAANEDEVAGAVNANQTLRRHQPTDAAVDDSHAGSDPASQRGRGGRLAAAFSEDFIPPHSPRKVARWALRYARWLSRPPADGVPLREVVRLATPAGRRPLDLFALSAAIESGGRRSRVLVGVGTPTPVLGRRLPSAPRWAVALLALLVLPSAALMALRSGDSGPAAVSVSALAPAPAGPSEGTPDVATAPGAPASASATISVPSTVLPAVPVEKPAQVPSPLSMAAAASVPSSSVPAVQALPGETAASAAVSRVAQAAADAVVTARPRPRPTRLAAGPVQLAPTLATSAKPSSVRIELPNIRALISEQDKAAAREARAVALSLEAARGAAVAPAPGPAPTTGAAPAPGASPVEAVVPVAVDAVPAASGAAVAAIGGAATAPALASGAAVYGISTRALRTRAEAEQVRAAMVALLRPAGTGFVVDIVAQGDDWLVVGYPYARAAEAEAARALLVLRGMRVRVLDF